MSDAGLTLALDQGSQSSRAVLYAPTGEQVAIAKVPVATSRSGGDFVEQDAAELVASLRHAIDEVVAVTGGADIRVAGLATQRSSLVCWNRASGEVLSPVISWQDRRAADWLDGFSEHNAEVHEITGLLLSPHYGVSKMVWCLEKLPEVAAAREAGELVIAPLASYLVFALLDERPVCADPANAGRTLLYDARSADWSSQLLDLFGIPREILPDCVPSVYSWGNLQAGSQHVPLQLLTGDQSAALFAGGSARTDTIYANLGTGAFLQRPTGPDRVTVHGLLSSVVYSDGTETDYVLEGTVNGAGSALNVVGEALGLSREDIQAGLNAWLKETPHPPLYLNGVSGLGSPWWIADFPSQFVGRSNDGNDAAAQLVAVIESIVFLLQANFDVAANAGSRPDNWIVTGGLAGIDGLCQRLADLSRVPVLRPEMHEATALGTARLLNLHEQGFQPVIAGKTFQPEDAGDLRERYARWHYAMSEVINTVCT